MARTWVITWEGEVYREVSLTLAECERVCDLTQQSWIALSPISSPKALGACIAVFMERNGHNAEEQWAKLREMSPLPLLRAVSWEEEDRPEEYDVPEGKVPIPVGKGSASKRKSTTTRSSSTTETSGPPGSPSDAPSETSD